MRGLTTLSFWEVSSEWLCLPYQSAWVHSVTSIGHGPGHTVDTT